MIFLLPAINAYSLENRRGNRQIRLINSDIYCISINNCLLFIKTLFSKKQVKIFKHFIADRYLLFLKIKNDRQPHLFKYLLI